MFGWEEVCFENREGNSEGVLSACAARKVGKVMDDDGSTTAQVQSRDEGNSRIIGAEAKGKRALRVDVTGGR